MPGVPKTGHDRTCLADSAKLQRGWKVSSEVGCGAIARINAHRCVTADLQDHNNELTNRRGLVVKRSLSKVMRSSTLDGQNEEENRTKPARTDLNRAVVCERA